MQPEEEDQQLRTVALQNAQSILLARQRAEDELIRAKQALEIKSAELAASLATMRVTLESTFDGILVTDEAGRITDFNEKYLQMWGASRALVAAGDHDRLLQDLCVRVKQPERFIARAHEIHASAGAESLDLLELDDGRIFERFSSVQVAGGRPGGRVWSFRDVTESKRAEEALRDETRMLELLNETGRAIASELDLPSLVQVVTDAATKLS